ncbi:MAG: alpha/beta fold hydrolase [Leptolyngbyaceae cyanobacterium CSU_1_3]|nr:alpha/beta fold hydrolase [Leptolyngbyaceae cyanobacterium CSU_1_3]
MTITTQSYAAARTIVQKTKSYEDSLPIRNEGCRSRFLLHSAPTPKVCLFFHGFTAAPYQFLPMGKTFYRAGYNVIIPRMPGHGKAGDWGEDNPPPLPTTPDIYKQFALNWLQKAQALGNRVVVGGLSGGGTMTAWLSLEKAEQIDRALLFAPYLSGSNKVIDLIVNVFSSYFSWKTNEPEKVVGYGGFEVPALRVFLEMGREILQRSQTHKSAPMFVISTEADQAVSNLDHQTLIENSLKRQPKSWYYCFDQLLNIPHTMMTQAEGNDWENVLNSMAKAYVESNLTWAEVEDIAYRMTQGRTFDQAAADLKLRDRASRDMPTVLTMVDKREIVIKRNPSWRDQF